jgi:Holliday junction resolvase
MASEVDMDTNCFFIFDIRTRKKEFIYLLKEDIAELLDKINNPHIYKSG